MASRAPITPTAASEPGFRINGCDPFTFEDAVYYIEAAHAVACIGQTAMSEDPDLNGKIVAGTFDAITLLLAHAGRIHEGRA
jgi:hypothetical protein